MQNKILKVNYLNLLVFILSIVYIFIAPKMALALSPQSIIIDLTVPSSATVGSTFLVEGTASSGLPVDITVTGDCSISSDTVTITAASNDCVVHFNQVGDATFDPALEVTETVVTLSTNQTTPDGSGSAVVNNTTPQVVITNASQTANITISSGTSNPEINLSSFISGGTGTIPAMNIISNNANNTSVEIPASTVVTSALNTWNGIISAPTVTTVSLPPSGINTSTLSMAIEVGFTGAKLSFNKAVRILLPGQAGKKAGYVGTGVSFTEIANTCTLDNQATGDALPADGDCKIDSGSDMAIWTKHFTSFATYTQSSSNTGPSHIGSGAQLSTPAPVDTPVDTSNTPLDTPSPVVAVVSENIVDIPDTSSQTTTEPVKKVVKQKPALKTEQTDEQASATETEQTNTENNLIASAGAVKGALVDFTSPYTWLVIVLIFSSAYSVYNFKRNKKVTDLKQPNSKQAK